MGRGGRWVLVDMKEYFWGGLKLEVCILYGTTRLKEVPIAHEERDSIAAAWSVPLQERSEFAKNVQGRTLFKRLE